MSIQYVTDMAMMPVVAPAPSLNNGVSSASADDTKFIRPADGAFRSLSAGHENNSRRYIY